MRGPSFRHWSNEATCWRQKRPYVLVDFHGGMHALPNLINGKTVRTKDIRAFLERDFPCDGLPSVEEASQLTAGHRKLIEQSVRDSRQAERFEKLRHAQTDWGAATERERDMAKMMAAMTILGTSSGKKPAGAVPTRT